MITADVMEGLRKLADESVHCVVTSPPYWGLRSYLPADHPRKRDEIGSEPTLQEHIARMVEVFREVRRVLRPDGTLWLNYGDMWANDTKWGGSSGGKHVAGLHGATGVGRSKRQTGLKPKDLCMAPHRLAIALQDDGWWVRSDIVWHKPNPMPSSVRDRPTPAKEFVFLLSKSARYHYNAEAIAERRSSLEDANEFRGGSYVGGEPGPRKVRGNRKIKIPGGWDVGAGSHGTINRTGRTSATYKNEESGDRRREGFNGRWDAAETTGAEALTRNARDVWTVATEPFKEAHYATFPTEIARRCILAGCPVGGTVLDPFGGSGTVGLVADQLQRHAILIDVDERNRPMAARRLTDDAPLLAKIEMAN